MNAGTSLGEIGSLIESVRIMGSDGNIKDIDCDASFFRYRNNNFLGDDEIILSAVIRHNGINKDITEKINDYLAYRKTTQPLTTKNCGSVFKNLEKHIAGKTIDLLGLKGFGPEHLTVSYMHGNFIENHAEGTAEEFERLVQALCSEIERLSGLKFELEVKVY